MSRSTRIRLPDAESQSVDRLLPTRRSFLGQAARGLCGLSLLPAGSLLASRLSRPQESPGTIQAATLGGHVVARLGLGTYPISRLPSDDEAQQVLQHAFELGIRYVDTAPSYSNGRAERRIGEVLEAFDRSQFVLATKTLKRRADEARRELEESLRRLGVERVEGIQIHAVSSDWERLFAKGAVIEGLEKARDEGLVQWIGITGHADPDSIAQAIRRYPFATALVPVNPIDVQHRSFVRRLLPIAAERKVAVVAMKLFAGGGLISGNALKAAECVTYALAQPAVSVIVPGCSTIDQVDADFETARRFQMPDEDWLRDIEQKAGKHQGKASEWYKDD